MQSCLLKILAHIKTSGYSILKNIKRFGIRIKLLRDPYELRQISPQQHNKNSGPVPRIGFLLFTSQANVEVFLALQETIKSIIDQGSQQWHIFLPEFSTKSDLALIQADPRITQIDYLPSARTLVQQNPEIDFYTIMEAGDILLPGALSEITRLVQQTCCAVLYTDEDTHNPNGKRSCPLLKPDWSPDLLQAYPYWGKLTLYSRSLLTRLDIDILPANQHLLALQAAAQTSNIAHLHQVVVSCPKRQDSYNLQQRESNPSIVSASWSLESSITVDPVSPDMQIPPLVSIIVCCRDKAHLTKRCLESIFQRSHYQNFELLLVDNDSQRAETLALYQYWQRKEARFRLTKISLPFNFSRLNNQAVTIAQGDHLLFLNNDTEVISENWLDELVSFCQKPHIGSAGPLLLYRNGTIQHAGILVDRGSIRHAFYRQRPVLPGYMKRLAVPSNFSALTAACLMIRREVFEQVNGFDEALGTAYNDVDLCLKLSKKGFYHTLLPQIRLYHYESATRGYDIFSQKRSRLDQEYRYLQARWPEIMEPDPFYHAMFSPLGSSFDDYS